MGICILYSNWFPAKVSINTVLIYYGNISFIRTLHKILCNQNFHALVPKPQT